MKMVSAYIHSFMLEKVTDSLRDKHIHGVTVVDCCGFGRQTANDSPHYLDADVRIGFAKKKKIEIVRTDDDLPNVVAIIRESARTGRHGDGKIFVSSILDAIDIRTETSGDNIL